MVVRLMLGRFDFKLQVIRIDMFYQINLKQYNNC
jgi:hypothetical protein